MKLPEKIDYNPDECNGKPINDVNIEYKNDYIASYEEYESDSFLNPGRIVKKPDVALAKWNSRYPKGLEDWVNNNTHVPVRTVEETIMKLNQVIDYLEEKENSAIQMEVERIIPDFHKKLERTKGDI